MDRRSLVNDLHKDFVEEMHDCNKYLDMAIASEAMNDPKITKGLYMMAHDEFTHAKFMRMCAVEEGIPISEEDNHKWKELEERVHRIFR